MFIIVGMNNFGNKIPFFGAARNQKAWGLLVNLTQAHFSLNIVNVIDKKCVILVQRSLTSRPFAGAPEGLIT